MVNVYVHVLLLEEGLDRFHKCFRKGEKPASRKGYPYNGGPFGRVAWELVPIFPLISLY
jgi:hypothetical protein